MVKPRHLTIYGPPGTGKTRRLLELVDRHVRSNPGRVLFCSHTRAAAQEAMSRWPVEHAEQVDISTLHALCFRALKMSRAQTVDDFKLTAFGEEFGIDMSQDGVGRDFMEVLSLARAKCITPGEGYDRSWRPGSQSHFEAFEQSYTQWKEVYGYMDFNDMLAVGAQRLRMDMVRYSVVAIDEAQDNTPLHWAVIYKLFALLPNARFIIAGDDDQALYSFAGADPHGMLEFEGRVHAEQEILSQSYRITQQVYDLAQAIIRRVSSRVQKDYAPRQDADGKPAQGGYEVWPHMDHLQLSRTRDSLLLYNDRFVRTEVEPILQENGFSYRALNGWPSPLDNRAGQALRITSTHTLAQIEESEELRNQVRAGLSGRGQQVWDSIGIRQIMAHIQRRDWHVMAVRPQHIDYLQAVDFEAPQNVRISTMHGAKGLQGDDVHLILSLSPRAWQEAAVEPDHLHRLLYTAVTRTKENLYIYDGENGYELPAEYR